MSASVRESLGGSPWPADALEVCVEPWGQVVDFFAGVPAGVWVAAMTAKVVLTTATWSVARRRVRRAGQRLANPELVAGRRRRDTALTVAAMIPATLFLCMVIAGVDARSGRVRLQRAGLARRLGVPGPGDA